jgi:hypothetical protein
MSKRLRTRPRLFSRYVWAGLLVAVLLLAAAVLLWWPHP